MIGRRSFFGSLLGAGPLVLPAISAALPQETHALDFAQPICPRCCYMQEIPRRYNYATAEEYERVITSPQTITCINTECRTPMTVTFARRI